MVVVGVGGLLTSSRHSLPTGTDPTKLRTQKSRKQALDLFIRYYHSTSYLLHQPIVAVMIEACMLQLITDPCYDAEVITACLSANGVRRSSQSKKLRTSIGSSKNSPMEVWISLHVMYLGYLGGRKKLVVPSAL